MTAVLGGDEAAVLAAIDKHGLTPANVNGAGQIVAAGTLSELAEFAADPPARARLIPLSVAGAFHTRHMAPAVDELRAARRLSGVLRAASCTPGRARLARPVSVPAGGSSMIALTPRPVIDCMHLSQRTGALT